jgi:uncharacterized membrane protein
LSLPSAQPNSAPIDAPYAGPSIQVNTQNNHLHIGQIDLPDPARFNALPPEAQKVLLAMTQKEQTFRQTAITRQQTEDARFNKRNQWQAFITRTIAQLSSLVLSVLVFYKALEFVKAGMTAQGFTVMLGAMAAFVIAVVTGKMAQGKQAANSSDKP